MSRGIVYNPLDPGKTIRHMLSMSPNFVDVTTVAGSVQQIRHGLGRIPRGYVVVKQPGGYVYWHGRGPDDPADTTEILYTRFSISGLALTLAIY